MDCDVYSACFTAVVDEEVLFERYGDCAIKFGPTVSFLMGFFTPTVKECAKLYKVLYAPGIFENYLRRAILRPYRIAAPEEWPRLHNYLNQVISWWSCIVKSPYWDNEKENRLIFYLPKDEQFRNRLLEECPEITEDNWDHLMISLKPILKDITVLSTNESSIDHVLSSLGDNWGCKQKGSIDNSPYLQYYALLDNREDFRGEPDS